MKYLLIVLAVAFAMPSMAEGDAPKRMTSAEKKAALLEKYDINKDGNLDSGRAPTGGNKFPLPVKRMGGQYSANCLAADGTAQPGLKPIQTGRETGH